MKKLAFPGRSLTTLFSRQIRLLLPPKQQSRFYLSLFFIIFLGSIPRLMYLHAHWSSDESLWLDRSAQFMSAVKKGEFSETLVTHHPGVTTMWLAGLRTFFLGFRLNVNLENLVQGRLFIGIVVWAGISIAGLLLYRLFGQWIALAGFVTLACSPLFLAQSRRVHTDALATTFIMLTVLLLLLYCQDRHRHRYLIFSGITFGLALLSKSHALILLTWLPVYLFLFRKKGTDGMRTAMVEMFSFLSCTTLAVIVLWPIFWNPLFGLMAMGLLGFTCVLFRKWKKSPCPRWILGIAFAWLCLVGICVVQTMWRVFDGVNWAITTPHEVKHIFLGKVVYDPGWLFYPFILTIKSTPLMLPLALLGCVLLWRKRNFSAETALQFRMGLALITFVVLFTVCLSATSKKLSRYLLPAFSILDILAAIGFVEAIKWCYATLVPPLRTKASMKYKTGVAVLACIGFFFIQVMPVFARHPYYGTYYNPCWKVTDITKLVTVGDASGLDIAASYLNQKTEAYRMRVQVSPLARSFVRYYFRGFAYRTNEEIDVLPDYEVVYIRDLQIGRVPKTGTLNGELEAVVTLNGIDHVWIYRISDKVPP